MILEGDRSRVQVWDITTGTPVGSVACAFGHYMDVGFLPDGSALVCVGGILEPGSHNVIGSMVQLCDLRTGKIVRIPGHSKCVDSVAIVPDSTKFATLSGDGSVRLWQRRSGSGGPFRFTAPTEHDKVVRLNIKPVTAAKADRGSKEPEVGALLATLQQSTYRSTVSSIEFSPDGKHLFVVSGEEDCKLWHVPTWNEKKSSSAECDYFSTPAALSPESEVLANLDGEILRVWNLAGNTATLIKSIPVWPGSAVDELHYCEWFHDGTLLSRSHSGGFQFLKATATQGVGSLTSIAYAQYVTAKKNASFKYGPNLDNGIFSPCGRYWAFFTDYSGIDNPFSVRVFSATGNPLMKLSLPAKPEDFRPRGLKFSRNGQILAASLFGGATRFMKDTWLVCLFDTGTWKGPVLSNEKTLKGEVGTCVDFRLCDISSDGQLAATSAIVGVKTSKEMKYRRIVTTWKTATGERLTQFEANFTGTVFFTLDGKTLVTGVRPRADARFAWDRFDPKAEQEIVFWDVETGQRCFEIRDHEISTIALSPNGRMLATGHENAEVRIWKTPLDVRPTAVTVPSGNRTSRPLDASTPSHLPDTRLDTPQTKPSPPSSELLTAKKRSVPSGESLTEALAVVKEVYGDEFAAAKTAVRKSAFAKKLLTKANESTDPTSRYALLRVAKDAAKDAGDGQTAFRAIDEMDRAFQVDAVRMKASILYAGSKQAQSAAQHKSVAEQSLKLMNDAIAKDDLDLASKLGTMALSEVRKAEDTALLKEIVARRTKVEHLAESHAAVKTALAALEDNPTDPDANLVVGKYRCLVQGDWKHGLPMLALGSDTAFKALAMKEQGDVSNANEQVALGDAWWSLGEKEGGTAKAKERAVFWYRKALPGLTGLAKDKVEKRIAVSATAQSHWNVARQDWIVLFRSSDPSIWNKDVNEGESRYAITLKIVPDRIQWLKMQVSERQYVIIPMSKDRLGVLWNYGKYGWNGTGKFEWNAHRLGIFSTARQGNKGEIVITSTAGQPHYLGWGFGGMHFSDKGQCYTWEGKTLPSTVFEISVKDGGLSPEEKKHLLK